MQAHLTHTEIIRRLKRAKGHLETVIGMIEQGRECLDLAQQLHAVESAIASAKKTLVHDHIDHCLDHAVRAKSKSARSTIREFKAITKYL